ncbi:hypothetical protein GGR57DRAFT_479048 [Xylariaceae sp. FL1272]|nr:hypothetical protein GGR57DRAFT_479048 [Xylariaceae sp. FL1272]
MSAHPDHAGISGNNPNYQNEPAELDGNSPWPRPLQSHPVGVVSPHTNEPADHRPYIQSPMSGTKDNATNDQYFPPPPGPPPSGAKQQYKAYVPPPARPPKEGNEEQYNYPPPPPGPPPSHAHSDERPPEFSPPPSAHVGEKPQEFPPSTSAHADEKPPEFPPPSSPYTDEKPPAFPPPPSYAEEFPQVQDHVYEDHKPPVLPPRPGPSQGAPQYFPPPPVSPSQAPPQFAPPPGPSPQAAAAAGTSSSTHKSGGWQQKLYELSLKASGPINKLTNKLGSEAFWPSSLDTECDKAARILKSFCKDGFYTSTPPSRPTTSEGKPARSPGPSSTSKTLVKIPTSAIANAKGLAIFTTFRTGLHISGAGGSGVVVSRLPDGSWSPPAGFLVHTLGAGFMIGFDVYDCVCVLNTQQAVEAFMKSARLSLGGELAVVAGPVGAGRGLEGAGGFGGSTSPTNQEKDKLQVQGSNSRPGSSSGKKECDGKPVWSYMKSRGFYAGVQADGTVIVNRPGANDAFYGERGITVERILKGQVSHNPDRNWNGKGKEKGDYIVMWPEGGRQLMEVLKAAEGRRADDKVLRDVGNGPTPGDLAPEGGKGLGEAGVAK